MTEAEQILTELGFAPERHGMDYAVRGLADRLARTERALTETREMAADAEKRGAVKALRIEAMRGLDASEAAKAREGVFKDFAVHLMKGLSQEMARRADVIESGEVTL